MSQQILAGASGYSFKEWKGHFYPPKLAAADMLDYYAQRLPTVEINSSFYALPKPESLQRWAQTVPANFRFAIKAPAAITHQARLKSDADDTLGAFYAALENLDEKRGPVLFQLPPNMKKDLPRLDAFLQRLRPDHRLTFEFRHDSWFDDAVYARLGEARAALCVSEREDATAPPLVATADWGYLRLRLEQYDEASLGAWLSRCRELAWKRVFVYFMHAPTAPAYAARIMALAQS
jgi:uncharacterized protein YecE (DUF72 family)